jgi:inositol oxygenase
MFAKLKHLFHFAHVVFYRFDLYTKRHESFELASVKDYYQPIIEKYLGSGPIFW